MTVRIEVPARVRTRHRQAGHWLDQFIDGHPAACAATNAAGVAVVDGDVQLTYGELDVAVRGTAAGLHRQGVGPGQVVSWQLPNWHEAPILHHAVLRLGAVSNPIVPIYRHREVGYMLARARSRMVVVPGTFRGFDHAGMIGELRGDLPDLEHVVVVRPDAGHSGIDLATLATEPGGTLPERPGTPDDPALLMFTSGTTADPKGVVHTHNTLDYVNRSIIDVYGLGPEDVVFMPSPVAHITGLLYGLQLPAMLGTAVVLQDVWEPRRALQSIGRHRCTFTVAATPFLHGLTHDPTLPAHDFGSLRVFACGGADVPSALIEAAGVRLGCAATRVYGSTEFPTLSTSPPGAPLHRRARTDGRVIGAAEYRVVGDDDVEVGTGEIGELQVRGPELFPGYLDAADGRGAFTTDGFFRTVTWPRPTPTGTSPSGDARRTSSCAAARTSR